MPAKKAETPKTKKPRVSKVSFVLHIPGSLPEKLSVKADSSIEEALADRNTQEGYVFTANGENVDKKYIIQKGDEIRIGLKLKNGK